MRLPPPGFKQPIPDPSEQFMEDSDLRWALLAEMLDEIMAQRGIKATLVIDPDE
jgi:hypothetical protein